MNISTRPIQPGDIPFLINYWLTADEAFLKSMGADIKKIPSREILEQMLSEQIITSLPEKKSYCIIWLENNQPIGHSNVNKIKFGEEAYMHLHLWKNETRQKGLGAAFVKLSLPWFFEDLQLKRIYSEPYALNPAPNKTLEKAGFHFVKEYITTPGLLNFEQIVNLWRMDRVSR
jgi:RimJ/RimL family protein N-acetyltransferase